MTDRQFDAYRALLLDSLKEALAVTPNNETLKRIIERLEAELKRP